MSIWSSFIKLKGAGEEKNSTDRNYAPASYDAFRYAIVDVEVGLKDHKIHDIGALRYDGAVYHEDVN